MAKIDKEILSESFGFSYAMLNSNPQLKKLFNKAVAENWAPDMFVARVRGTSWYKKTSESKRNAQLQKKSDPATFNTMVKQTGARVSILAHELGAQMSLKTINRYAAAAYAGGWDDNQLRRNLASHVGRDKRTGLLEGQAGEWNRQWKEYAGSMGVEYSPSQYTKWARRATKGLIAPEDVLGWMQEQARSKYPQFAGRIARGETMDDVAEPYRQTIAKLLEVDPQSVTFKSRLLQQGLNARTKKGEPTSIPLYKYEDVVRKDPRWVNTDNAKEAGDAAVKSLGTMFGKIS